jgi:hypothetical protein
LFEPQFSFLAPIDSWKSAHLKIVRWTPDASFSRSHSSVGWFRYAGQRYEWSAVSVKP